MEIVVLGIDHRSQRSDLMLTQEIARLCRKHEITLITEETRREDATVARQVANECGIDWLPVDMDKEERKSAGIYETLCKRPAFDYDPDTGQRPERHLYFRHADGIREEYWLDKAEAAKNGARTLLVCGAVHVDPVAEKAEARGRSVAAKLFFPESLAALKAEILDE
jgi:hypothetical protein